MRAREFVSEATDINAPPPDVKWSMDTDAEDGKPVHVASWKDPKGQTVRSLFKPNDEGTSAKVLFDRPDKAGNPSYSRTGQGNAPQVFTGALSNTKNFLDNNPTIQSVNFDSEHPTRSSLYARMIDKHAPQAGLVGSANVKSPAWGETEFTLNRSTNDQQHQPIYKQVRDSIPALQKDVRNPPGTRLGAPLPPTDSPTVPKTGPGLSLERPPGYKQNTGSSTATATKLPPPGKAIPPSVMGKAVTPSIAGSHGNSPNGQAFQDTLDLIKRKMPRI
jgi:hypothetical protein